MDLRLRSLEHLDERAVPLPHGTEVVTRVDRIIRERRIPQGSVGRVTKVSGDELDVTTIGVGVVSYSRGELSPRRVGQVLFAHRRANAWDALRPCVVLETRSVRARGGSRAATPTTIAVASSLFPSPGARGSSRRPKTWSAPTAVRRTQPPARPYARRSARLAR
jgi:hypothetical protein